MLHQSFQIFPQLSFLRNQKWNKTVETIKKWKNIIAQSTSGLSKDLFGDNTERSKSGCMFIIFSNWLLFGGNFLGGSFDFFKITLHLFKRIQLLSHPTLSMYRNYYMIHFKGANQFFKHICQRWIMWFAFHY